jgi:hypothetical protein
MFYLRRHSEAPRFHQRYYPAYSKTPVAERSTRSAVRS